MKYIPLVNIKQGTHSVPRFSNGNSLPLTQLPFGMAAFAPQTRASQYSLFFHPSDRSLEGVRLTHQPSPWVGDFGAFTMMPQCGKPQTSFDARWSGYRPADAVLSPNYMRLRFLRSESTFELSPTERGAAVQVTYDRKDETPFFSIIKVNNEIDFKIDADNRIVTGWTNSHIYPVPDNYRMYFVLKFNCDILTDQCVIEDNEAMHIALSDHNVLVQLAISFICDDQATLNLSRELFGKSFADIKFSGETIWEEKLSKIQVQSSDNDKMRTFYSCLYRTFLYPNKIHEIDGDGNTIHYDVFGGGTKPGVMYTNNGFWDTFRTVYPLYSIIDVDAYAEILEGYINTYRDSGWLPKWTSLSEAGMMPGTMIDGVIADAAVKGIISGDLLRTAFEGMLKHAETVGDAVFGRNGIAEYLKYGHVPRGAAREAVNCTLDYAYGDFCIARVAEVLGETEIMKKYDIRAKNYQKIFDKETGFMRSRTPEGEFTTGFDPFNWGEDYTEGSAWQNSFAVYHDVDGLAELYGGKNKLISKLDELFNTPPRYNVGGYGFEIHEMTEMAAVDFGQCAISNQPSFHLPYMFAALGDLSKTQYWAERLVNEAFSWHDDGFPGDEDNGTTSAWYVFSVMGLYPLCPGKPEFIKGKRIFDSIIINGKDFNVDVFDTAVIPYEQVK